MNKNVIKINLDKLFKNEEYERIKNTKKCKIKQNLQFF